MSKEIERMLQLLDAESAKLMLADLKDDTKRTPQLYNAIAKLLDRHSFSISKVQPDKDILGSLAEALPDLTDDDLYDYGQEYQS